MPDLPIESLLQIVADLRQELAAAMCAMPPFRVGPRRDASIICAMAFRDFASSFFGRLRKEELPNFTAPVGSPSDTVALRAARADMVRQQLRPRGICDAKVLCAMARLPRHEFLPVPIRTEAYGDKAVAIGEGQTISQPYIVAFMTSQLAPRLTSRVLEIGTGTGYQTALLAMLAEKVYTIERIESLHRLSSRLLLDMGFSNIFFRLADGSGGWPEQGPFDRIIITAAAPAVAAPLLDQLAPGGRMILPLGDRSSQNLVLVEKEDHGIRQTLLLACRFVPLLGEFAWSD